jgi:hypothetical protein
MHLAVRSGRELHHRGVAGRRTVIGPLREIAEREVSVLVIADPDPLVAPAGLGEPMLESDLDIDVLICRPPGSNDGELPDDFAEV